MPATRFLSELLDGQTIGYANGPATAVGRTNATTTALPNVTVGLGSSWTCLAYNSFSMRLRFDTANDTPISLSADRAFAWSLDSGNAGAAKDVILRRDDAGILAQRNGTNAQAFRLYNTYTDASNYERGFVRWNSNRLEIGTEAAGTGTSRNLVLTTHLVNNGDIDGQRLYLQGTSHYFYSQYGRLYFKSGGNGIEFTAAVRTSNANVLMLNLATADPLVDGQLWNDAGTLKISAGP